jgi:hypothetical protein
MSGKPSNEKTAELYLALKNARELEVKLNKEMAEIERLQASIELCRRESATQKRIVLDLMSKMDVAANGNYGWENRVLWFLAELTRQAEQAPQPARNET